MHHLLPGTFPNLLDIHGERLWHIELRKTAPHPSLSSWGLLWMIELCSYSLNQVNSLAKTTSGRNKKESWEKVNKSLEEILNPDLDLNASLSLPLSPSPSLCVSLSLSLSSHPLPPSLSFFYTTYHSKSNVSQTAGCLSSPVTVSPINKSYQLLTM